MELIATAAFFTFLGCYGMGAKRRDVLSMPLWYTSWRWGRDFVGAIDLFVFVIALAGIWAAFTALPWWQVVLVYLGTSLFVTPQITSRTEPLNWQLLGLPGIVLAFFLMP